MNLSRLVDRDEVQLGHMHSSCWSSRDFPNQAKPEAGYSSKVTQFDSQLNQPMNQASKQASKQGLREREAEGSTKSKKASEGQEGG